MLRQKRFWFGLIISVAFLAIFLAKTNFGEIKDAFGGADYPLAFASVGLYFAGFWVRSMRWGYIVQPVSRIRTRRLYPVVLIGLMANNIAPARIGELVRAYLIGERESMNKSTALGTIAVDRAFDGMTLVAFLAISVSFFGHSAGVKAIGVVTTIAFALATAMLAFLTLSPHARVLLSRLVTLLPGGLALRLEGMIDSFLTGLAAIRNPLLLIKAAGASVCSWLLETSMYYVVGQAFHLGVGFHVYLLIVASANLALSLLASPGGVGPFDFASKQVLVSFGVGSAKAAAYTLALHAILLVPVIIVGFILLGLTQFSFSQVMGMQSPPGPPAPLQSLE